MTYMIDSVSAIIYEVQTSVPERSSRFLEGQNVFMLQLYPYIKIYINAMIIFTLNLLIHELNLSTFSIKYFWARKYINLIKVYMTVHDRRKVT